MNDLNAMGVTQQACHCCDVLVDANKVPYGSESRCPRCDAVLHRPKANSVERTLALSLTGLFLFIPANTLPTLGIKVLGNFSEGTLLSGVLALFHGGMWGVAGLVFAASILFPLVKLLLSFLVSASLHFNWYSIHLKTWMRWQHHLDEWAMLEVYTLGIIVACVKLMGVAQLHFGLGLYSFAALLIATNLLSTVFDDELFWERLGYLEVQNDQ